MRAETPARPVSSGRRVRHDVRDGLAVMGFSLGASAGLTLLLQLLLVLGK